MDTPVISSNVKHETVQSIEPPMVDRRTWAMCPTAGSEGNVFKKPLSTTGILDTLGRIHQGPSLKRESGPFIHGSAMPSTRAQKLNAEAVGLDVHIHPTGQTGHPTKRSLLGFLSQFLSGYIYISFAIRPVDPWYDRSYTVNGLHARCVWGSNLWYILFPPTPFFHGAAPVGGVSL